MKDDIDFNIYFIDLIKSRPCLYDFNQSSYNNRSFQDATWSEISKKLNETVADCKERWKNLRGCYTRHLKKNRIPPGSSAKPVKPYYLAEHLKFIDKFTKPRQRKELKEEDTTVELERETSSEGEEESLEFASPAAPICNVSAIPIDYYQPRTKIAKLDENHDPDLSFLYSLLPDVNDMNPEQKRRFKIGVLKLASDILQEGTSRASPNSDS